MSKIEYKFELSGQVWTGSQLERLEYERNLHVLHQMKRHGIPIMDGDKELTDDDIDCLSMSDAWRVSIQNRSSHSGKEIAEKYKESMQRSDEMWKELGFSLEKPMKRSQCLMKVEGVTLQEFMGVFKLMQADEKIGLAAHPEHFMSIMTEDEIIGIEPFGMYGTPTLVNVAICPAEKLGERIKADLKPEYPLSMAGLATLTDKKTMVNCPMHQFRATETGFEVLTAVYWPEHTPDEIVSGHELHLAMEFYEGVKLVEQHKK